MNAVFKLLGALATVAAIYGNDLIVIPHIPADASSFESFVVLENRSQDELPASIEGFSDGVPQSLQKMLPPDSRTEYTLEELFGDAKVTHIFVQRLEGLFAGVTYRPIANPANAVFVEGITKFSDRWRIYPGDWNDTFDGLVVVNPHCFNSEYAIVQYDRDGSRLAGMADLEVLRNNGKNVINLASVFRQAESSYVEITSEIGLAVLAIKGSLNPNSEASFLVGNLAAPLPNQEALRREIQAQRAKWFQSGVGLDYRYQLQRSCFCAPASRLEAVITVQGGELSAMTYVADGTAVPLGETRHFYTVDELFDLAEAALDEGASRVQMSFDETLGYPTSLFIDQDLCTADEEINYVASDLEVL